jgi:hypothetical protein
MQGNRQARDPHGKVFPDRDELATRDNRIADAQLDRLLHMRVQNKNLSFLGSKKLPDADPDFPDANLEIRAYGMQRVASALERRGVAGGSRRIQLAQGDDLGERLRLRCRGCGS